MARRWFSLIGAALNQKKAFLPIEKLKDSLVRNSDLHDTFHGFIIFEVSWSDVRGINYVNELLVFFPLWNVSPVFIYFLFEIQKGFKFPLYLSSADRHINGSGGEDNEEVGI